VPNIELADVSNVTLVLTIALYAVAMLAYACDFAFGKRQSAAASPARRPERAEAALVGAASGTEFAGHAFPADPGDPGELADLRSSGARTAGAPGPGGGAGSGANGDGSQAAGGGPAGDGHATASAGGLPEPSATAALQSPWPQGIWLRWAFLLTCAGLVLHLISVAT
jgi:hypothetical protein